MRPRFFLLAISLTAAAATPAMAANEAEQRTPVRLSVDMEVLSDYRYRGVSLSGGEPAVQAEAYLELDPGIFASLWGSTLSGTEVELQVGAGYSADLTDKLNVQVGINYNAYPSASSENYYAVGAALSYSYANLKPVAGVEYAPKQAHLRDEEGFKRDNLYAFLALDVTVAGTPVTLTGQIGYETGLFDTRAKGGKWDWLIGARAETKWLNFGLSYIDSNGNRLEKPGRNLADETLVASVGRSF